MSDNAEMSRPSQDRLVAEQFGARAAAYLNSPVHAQGPDLARLVELAQASHPVRALDIGCGGGHVTYALAPLAEAVTACDLSPEMLETVSAESTRRGLANVSTAKGCAEALPFAVASFDFLASRYSAHHWSDFAAGLREARRVARPGATAVFMDVLGADRPDIDTWLQSLELLRDPSHVRDYSLSQWSRELAAAGFQVARVTTFRLPLDFTAWVGRMRPSATAVAALRELQIRMPAAVARHMDLSADGGFTLDCLICEARAR